MSAKEKIQKALKEVWGPGEVNAGQVYKSFDFDGTIQATGWWFSMFNGAKHFLGNSLAEARETIAQMVEEKRQQHQEWLDSRR